jgi:hypothetical protein
MKKLYVKPSRLIVSDCGDKNATIIKINLIIKNADIAYPTAFMAAGKIRIFIIRRHTNKTSYQAKLF